VQGGHAGTDGGATWAIALSPDDSMVFVTGRVESSHLQIDYATVAYRFAR
jgi:hypothetical protein